MELDLPKPVSNPLSQISRPVGHRAYPPQKYIGKYKKLSKVWQKSFFIKQKSEKELTKLTLGNTEFLKFENQCFY